MKLVDKDVVVAEIERIKQETIHSDAINVAAEQLSLILSFINTLDVKEVDLDKEIDNYFNTFIQRPYNATLFMKVRKTAEHFYGLGLKAQKGE